MRLADALRLATNKGAPVAASGQVEFTAVGTYEWIVPAGVTSISAVCIGQGICSGGALSYSNNIEVSSGETLSIQIQGGYFQFASIKRGETVLVRAENGSFISTSQYVDGGRAANGVGDVKYSGGAYPAGSGQRLSGGGGAAGYGANGSNGGGVGGTAYTGDGAARASSGGGGQGLKGVLSVGGSTLGGGGGIGGGGTYPKTGGAGRNGGANGAGASTASGGAGAGGSFGGGGGLGGGGSGAVRIIWGEGRSYPYLAEDV